MVCEVCEHSMLVCVLWCVCTVQIGFPRFANNPVNMKGALATVCAGFARCLCVWLCRVPSGAGARARPARARRPRPLAGSAAARGARGRVAALAGAKRWRTKIRSNSGFPRYYLTSNYVYYTVLRLYVGRSLYRGWCGTSNEEMGLLWPARCHRL